MKLQTLNDIFFTTVKRTREPVMLVRDATRWVPISAQELYRDVAGVARALSQWGLTKRLNLGDGAAANIGLTGCGAR